MPQHHFICRQCGEKEVITTRMGVSPPHPWCTECSRTYAKVFGFGFTPVPIEISSPSVGKHGSKRSYQTALDQHSAEHTERLGREINYSSFDPRDPDQSPLN